MYGAVIFDDNDQPGPGWASVRGEPAVRIRGTGDLSSDVYWWTSLGFMVFQKYAIFKANLKQKDYMRPDMTQIHLELGLHHSRMPAARITEISAEFFDRVMRLAAKHYGIAKPSENTLSEDLYKVLLRPERIISPEVNHALMQSYQTWSVCEGAIPDGARVVTFKRPRILHALEVLATPIPGEQWEFISEREMPAENKRVEWLINQSRPVIANASVQRIEPEYASVISYSAGSRGERSWMSHPELLTLSRFAKIHVKGAYLARSYEPQDVRIPMATGGALGMLSMSMGVLCENYWVALSSPHKRENRQVIYSPRAVWMSAADRFQMQVAALLMHSSGFHVKEYGRGCVHVAVPPGLLAEARSCAASAGLNSPLNVQEDIDIQAALAG